MRNADLLTDDQFFDIGKTIVEAVGDKEMLKMFAPIMGQFVLENFREIDDAIEDSSTNHESRYAAELGSTGCGKRRKLWG